MSNKVLGIIPARSGSKGLKNKNLRLLGGKPLIEWAALSAKKAKLLDTLICSTDDKEIAEAAKKLEINVPFMRPPELAQDKSLVIDVMLHALDQLEAQGQLFDFVCLIQATSPFVLPEDIDNAISLAFDSSADTVISGYHCGQRHPSAMFLMDERQSVRWFSDRENREKRRQDLEQIYMRSGLVYVFRSQQLRSGCLYGPKTQAIVIPEERAMSIDSERDLQFAEFLVHRQNKDC